MSERDNELPNRLDRLIGLISKMYAQDGERNLQELLVNSKIKVVEETHYDNWNGGQLGHDVHLIVSENLLLPIIKVKAEIEQRICRDLNTYRDVPGEYVANVVLELQFDPDSDWRRASGLLTSTTKVVSDSAESRIWRSGGFRVFLSHKTEVKRQVSELKDALARYGVAGFVAHEDIHPTQEWQNEIEAALATADAFIAVMTEGFHESLWTDQEVGYALARGIPIIALRLGRDPYGFIAKFQALTCSWDSAPRAVVEILIKQDRMIGAYIESVRHASSFDEANMLAEILPKIESLNQEGARALVSAYNGNPEAKGGFGFNGLKPRLYGDGLVFHLERLGVRGYVFGKSREVIKS